MFIDENTPIRRSLHEPDQIKTEQASHKRVCRLAWVPYHIVPVSIQVN
jgi:hypothetical protein